MNVNPNIPIEGDRLLDLKEAAHRTRFAVSTLRAILYRGAGPTAIKPPGSNRWRFRATDIDAWIDAGVVKRRSKSAGVVKPRIKSAAKRVAEGARAE
jgi:predicted DNA-binding transcriptional regulator AlpA